MRLHIYLRRLLIAPLLLLTSACTHVANDSWTGKDKAQHFASAALAAAGTAYGEHQNWSDAKSRNLAYYFLLVLGLVRNGTTAAKQEPAGAGKILPGISLALLLVIVFIGQRIEPYRNPNRLNIKKMSHCPKLNPQ